MILYIKMLINVNRLNLIARSIYSNVSYRYIFVIGTMDIGQSLVPVCTGGSGTGAKFSSGRLLVQYHVRVSLSN